MSGNSIYNRRVSEYTSCMDFCNLLNLGFLRAKFTWTNWKDLSDLIQQRLDRVWVNLEWKLCFLKTFVSHLAHINLDHCLFSCLWFPILGRREWGLFVSNLSGSATMGSGISLRKLRKEIVRMCAMLLTCLQTRRKSGIRKFLRTFSGRKGTFQHGWWGLRP